MLSYHISLKNGRVFYVKLTYFLHILLLNLKDITTFPFLQRILISEIIFQEEIEMCTAVSFLCNDHYFGRNLDLEYCYRESVTITPRNYPFAFRNGLNITSHPAMIGVATVADGYPLYYDASNEAGLSMAGLNFPGNAHYSQPKNAKNSIAPFELIPWVLSQCNCTNEAKTLLENTRIDAIAFSEQYALSDLHWIVSDANKSITVEPRKTGICITENPVGVLTNNPPFEYHMQNLCNYMHLTNTEPENKLSKQLSLRPYSRGMGAMGLPGDLSSASRFVRACFTKLYSVTPQNEENAVTQFFHILGSVEQQDGCVKVNGKYEKTVYSSCCNTSKGIYYYTTYENRQITGVHLFRENLNTNDLISYPLLRCPQIRIEN